MRGGQNGTQRVSSKRGFASTVTWFTFATIIAFTVVTIFSAAPAQAPPLSGTSLLTGLSPLDVAATAEADSGDTSLAAGPSSALTTPDADEPPPSASVVTTLQEDDPAIAYSGEWIRAGHPAYQGDWAAASDDRGAAATVSFTGRSVVWIGPTGPTRGSARIYLDGRYVRSINTYDSTFNASEVLYSASFATQRPRTLTIEVRGTPGHPMVAIDAVVIRSEAQEEAPSPPAQPDPTPLPLATPTPLAFPTPDIGPTPTVAPTPTGTVVPTPAPTPLPQASPTPTLGSASNSVKVTSVTALLNALADNSVDEIVVANGTYHVSPASTKRSDSLWIGQRFAGRTTPVVVRAEQIGGVTFDGGGATSFGGISFEEGAHHQTWDGFVFANGSPTGTGVVTFGGHAGSPAAHNITLRNFTLARSLTSGAGVTDHGVYFAHAVGGVHDVLLDGLTVDGAGGLDTAVHFYHSTSGNPNAYNVTIRDLEVSGTGTALLFWDGTIRNIVVEDTTISGARTAVQYEVGGTVTLRRVNSTGSLVIGLYSTLMNSLGVYPSGLTIIDSTFR